MIARHNDYLGTLQYDEAIDELLAAWKAKVSVTRSGRRTWWRRIRPTR